MKSVLDKSSPNAVEPAVLKPLRLAVAALMPVFLILTSVRLMLTPAFIHLEYSMPGFPEDSYGFNLEDRLTWAPKALEYLLNDAGIDLLGDLRFEDGEAVFNERELRHMDDVKRLVRLALSVWTGAGILLIAGCTLLARFGGFAALLRALRGGAIASLVVMGVLVLTLAASFSFVFVGFHRIFFEGDSWLFYYSDTLIRLFPQRFWQDVFTFLVGGTVALAGLIWGIVRLVSFRWPRG